MKRRSLFLLPVLSLLVPLCHSMFTGSDEEGSPEDEYSTTYWCPTGQMLEKARVQRAQTEKMYRVVTDYDFDV